MEIVKRGNVFKELLGYRNYCKLLLADLISRFGDSVDSIAYGWMVYLLTGSKLLLGTLFAVNALPGIIFSPFSGVIVDRFSKKKVIIIGDLGRGIVVLLTGVMFYFNILRPWHLFIFTFINSIFEALTSPAKTVLNTLILPKDMMFKASSFSTSVNSFGELIGMALAGVIIATLGVAGAIIIDSFTFIMSALIIGIMKVEERLEKNNEMNIKNSFKDLKEGVLYVKCERLIVIYIIMAALANFCLTPLNVLMAVYVKDILNKGPETLSILGIGLMLGIIIGGIVISQIGDKFKKSTLAISGFLLLGLNYALMSLPGFFNNIFYPVAIATVAYFSIGFGAPLVSTPVRTFILTNTPRDILGRVTALMSMCCLSAMPLGGALTGVVSQYTSIEMMFLIMGIAIVIISLIPLLDREFRKE
ncbi:MAG: MFS transporter [Clostridiaceae bacterium]